MFLIEYDDINIRVENAEQPISISDHSAVVSDIEISWTASSAKEGITLDVTKLHENQVNSRLFGLEPSPAQRWGFQILEESATSPSFTKVWKLE